jgi:hypothetical protein
MNVPRDLLIFCPLTVKNPCAKIAFGYMASFKKLCNERDIDFDEYFNKDSETELYHFIGL